MSLTASDTVRPIVAASFLIQPSMRARAHSYAAISHASHVNEFHDGPDDK
jgi:hypothetical protein